MVWTGINVEGEGEWSARKHGGPKRRVWRNIHLGINEETLEVRAVEVTSRDIGDAPIRPELLAQFPVDLDMASITAPSHGLPANRCRATDALCEPKIRVAKLLCQNLMARDFDRHAAEFQVRVAVLNGFTALGSPVTKVVG